jgi:lysophospholipase L1-like esterase
MNSFAGLRRTAIFVVTLLAALALWGAPASAVAPPKVMAALGDSITRAFNSDGPGCPTGPSLDCPKNSWSTGTNPAVNSQFQRIQAIDPGRNPVAFNDAISGARAGTDRSIDLVNQVPTAVSQDPDYVTIEIGANDACRPQITDQTPTDTFSAHVRTALTTLVTADPKVYIEMLSIPNINQLHTIFTTPVPDLNALARWSAFNVCQALLANPLSTEQADVDRRAAFRAQVIAYNDALADVCAEFKRCLFDNNAVFNSSFTAADVATVTNTAPLPGIGSPADYFHPSLLGQKSLAETSWAATFPMN